MSARINRRMAIRAPFNYELSNSDPTVTDDDHLGFIVGDRWINESSDEEFVCLDNATGAAVWSSTTGSGGGGGSSDLDSIVVDIEDGVLVLDLVNGTVVHG